jgi:hypothetical protein
VLVLERVEEALQRRIARHIEAVRCVLARLCVASSHVVHTETTASTRPRPSGSCT